MEYKKKILSLFLRYFFLLIVALPSLNTFYFVFYPLTIYPLVFIFNLFFTASLNNNFIFIQEHNLTLTLISSCIAGSAYYLLLILNMSVPDISTRKRIFMILSSFSALLILNIFRIFLLVLIFRTSLFELTHQITWYFLSTVFVVLIWFAEVKIFKINSIPIYSDIKYLIQLYRR